MKTPKQMLEEITGEMMDAGILLEILYKNTDNSPDTDAGISCVVRSLLNTNEKAQAYIERLSDVSAPPQRDESGADIVDDVFDAVVTAKKLEEVAHIYCESYFTDKDSDNPSCHMSAIVYDYAQRVCSELKNIEAKLN